MAGETAKSVGRPVIISPAEFLEFSLGEESSNTDLYDYITITNTLPCPIAYKVKTTNPKKFRVRHCFGKIAPGQYSEITVFLRPEDARDLEKDKFLIQAIQMQDMGCDLRKTWRRASAESVMEYRLRCHVTKETKAKPAPSKSSSDVGNSVFSQQLESINMQISSLQATNQRLNRRLRVLTFTHLAFAFVMTTLIGLAAYVMTFGMDAIQIPLCANSEWLSCKPSSY